MLGMVRRGRVSGAIFTFSVMIGVRWSLLSLLSPLSAHVLPAMWALGQRSHSAWTPISAPSGGPRGGRASASRRLNGRCGADLRGQQSDPPYRRHTGFLGKVRGMDLRNYFPIKLNCYGVAGWEIQSAGSAPIRTFLINSSGNRNCHRRSFGTKIRRFGLRNGTLPAFSAKASP